MELLIARLGTTRLKDLVRDLRSCKTVAEERDVISRESATIRTHFKGDDPYLRYINVSKLLYIHMIGYSSHFGQIECLKLAASQKFMKKRLGYLGVTLLVDNKDVIVLITNSLKRDLQSQNQYVAGLALSVLGDVATVDMANDLYSEVDNILTRGNQYLLKKAFLCAVRLVKKVPSLAKRFIPRAKNVLFDKDHGILLTGITLIIELCKQDPAFLSSIRMPAVRELIKHFNNLLLSDTSHEYSIGGVQDPFLQVKILQLLRILGKGHSEASEKMSDVLSQVATSVNLQKNIVHSILYEAVLTIMEIESSKSLKILSINILGNLLAVKDNNIRYVALVTLTRIFANNKKEDISALQHHSTTIMSCLRDPDISIRKRALDLSFAVANPHNINIMTEELILFIQNYSADVKGATIYHLCQCIDANNSDTRNVVEATCRIIKSAGSKVEDEIVHYLVKTLSGSSKNIQSFATYLLCYFLIADSPMSYAKTALIKSCLWCLGEYGSMVVAVSPKDLMLEETITSFKYKTMPVMPITEKVVLDIICDIVRYTNKCAEICCYVLTTLVKLSVGFTKLESMETIKEMVGRFTNQNDFEVQQRACEFNEILKLSPESRKRILSPLPPYPKSSSNMRAFQWSVGNRAKDALISKSFSSIIAGPKDNINEDMILSQESVSQRDTQQSLKAPVDLMKEIFEDDIYIDQGKQTVSAHADPETQPCKRYILLDNNLLNIAAVVSKSSEVASSSNRHDNKIHIEFIVSNKGPVIMNNFQLKIAVPKYLQIVLHPPDASAIPAYGSTTQRAYITNPKKLHLKLRMKIEYIIGLDGHTEITFEYSSFDSSLWK